MENTSDENPYESPNFADSPAKNQPDKSLPNTKEIFQAIYYAVFQQLVIAIFFALILDGGAMLQRWFYAIGASWIMSLIILARHFFKLSKPITPLDIGIIKYGVWLALFLVLACETVINIFLI